jgi:hypothetical protein
MHDHESPMLSIGRGQVIMCPGPSGDLEHSRCWAAASIRLIGVNKHGTWPKDLAAAGHVNKSGLVLIVDIESDEFGIHPTETRSRAAHKERPSN